MARGKPDYHRATVIEAQKGVNFQPVLLDANGHMFIALTGQQIAVNNHPSDYFKKDEAIGSITNNVTVEQTDSDRILKVKENDTVHYLGVDTNGIMIARLKAASGEVLKDIAIDTSGVLLARLQGKTDNGLHDVAVDTEGLILARMQGGSTEGLKDVYVDTAGKMVARVQGVGGGLEPLFTIEDGGDEDLISDWVEAQDGLDPVNLEGFGKEGQHAMKLGIDASLSGSDYAQWVKNVAIGDMYQYRNMKIYMWVYIQTRDYLATISSALRYIIGNDPGNRIYFDFLKTQLSVGWNLLEMDLSSPSGSTGTVDWTDIDYQTINVNTILNNEADFYVVIDLIAVVKPNPSTGTLIDVATDKDGLMISKMVGSYGELHKPITADRFGHLRINISEQGLFTQVSNNYREKLIVSNVERIHTGAEDYTMLSLEGRGVVMGGSILHTGVSSHITCQVQTKIDGDDIGIYDIQILNTYGMTIPWSHIPHLIHYNDTDFRYVMMFPHPLTFENSLEIIIKEAGLSNGWTYLYLIYALF